MTDDARVPVTQISRDAAASVSRCGAMLKRQVRAGDHDYLPTVQAFAAHYLAGVAAGREEACQVLEQRIAEGYDAPSRKTDQCAHGKFGREDCIACYDDALHGTIAAIRQMGGE